MVESVITCIPVDAWEVVPEYTFSHYRESGSVDVLAWNRESRALLLVEVKTELDDLQNTLSVLDRKARLVPALVATERGWLADVVGVVLVAPDVTSFRESVAKHRATFAASFPRRTVEVKRWLAAPGSVLPESAGVGGSTLRAPAVADPDASSPAKLGPSAPRAPAVPNGRAVTFRGIWFLRLSDRVTRMGNRGGPRRVRATRKPEVMAADQTTSRK